MPYHTQTTNQFNHETDTITQHNWLIIHNNITIHKHIEKSNLWVCEYVSWLSVIMYARFSFRQVFSFLISVFLWPELWFWSPNLILSILLVSGEWKLRGSSSMMLQKFGRWASLFGLLCGWLCGRWKKCR